MGLALVSSGGGVYALADDVTPPSPAPSASAEPDLVSAQAAARQTGSRVEITGEETATSNSWANPDGTLTTQVFDAPVRIRQNGVWTPINTTLSDTGDSVTPRATTADLNFSDGGSGPFAEVKDGSQSLGLSVSSALPAPRLDGDTATYDNAVAGGDLVVTALPNGFSEQVVLDHKPDSAPTIRIPLTVSGGLKVSQTASGHLLLKDASGATVADAPAPHMWDSAVNPASGLPAHDEQVTSRIEDTDDGQILVLTPDQDFLDSPDVTYPLTIDPTTNLAVSTDTWLETPNYLDSQRSSGELRVGSYDSGTHKARAYLKFDDSAYAGAHIIDTNLSLYTYYSSTCLTTGDGVEVRRVTSDWDPSGITWSTMPSTTSTNQIVNKGAHGYDSSCPAAYMNFDVDGIVQAWADGAPNYGIQVRAVDETDPLSWRRYRSANYATGDDTYEPHLTVTYEDDDAGLTDSSHLTTPIVSSGKVTDSAGTPVSGADVVLYAWPDNDTEATMQEGDSFKLQPVAKAVSDSTGAYALRIANLSSLQPDTDSQGLVNFESVVYTPSAQGRFNFPRRLVTPTTSGSPSFLAAPVDTGGNAAADAPGADTSSLTATNPDANGSSDTAPVAVDLVLDTGSTVTPYAASMGATDESAPVVEDSDTPVAITDTSAFSAPTGDTGTDDPGPDYDAGVPKSCSSTVLKKYGGENVIIGQTYSATSKVSHTFTYAKGATSSLGVGVSGSGTFGSWKSGGTTSKSSTITNSYPSYGDHHGVYYKTQFNYDKYRVDCVTYGITPQDVQYHTHYEVRPTSYFGGATTSSASIPKTMSGTCAKYINGSHFQRTTTSAVTWANGADLAGDVGVNFSTETGYSNTATVDYSFHATRYLCGTAGSVGGSHPHRFVATGTSSGYTP
ncbi:DNRLRE domain-containing protein [Streptomyces sp. NPDC003996]